MMRPRPFWDGATRTRLHTPHGVVKVVAVEVVKIHPQGVWAHWVRSTAASVGSSVVATRLTGANLPRRPGKVPGGKKLNS